MIKSRKDKNLEQTANIDAQTLSSSIQNPTPNSKFQIPNSIIWSVFLLAVSTRATLLFFRPASELVPVELFIWFPVLVVISLFAFKGLLKKIYALDPGESAALALRASLSGFTGAILSAVIGLWSTSAGGLALSLLDLPVYFLTLGFFPRDSGPEPMLRGFALGVLVYSVYFAYRKRHDLVHSIIIGLLGWLAVSVVFAMPSVFMILTSAFHDIRAPLSANTMAESLSALSLNAYWINQQMARWFTGTTAQLGNAFILYTTSWVLLVFAAGQFWLKRRFLRSVVLEFDFFSILAALALGLSAGWSYLSWSVLDIPAWLLLLAILLSTFFIRQVDEHTPIFTFILLASSALLGFPILLASLIVVSLQLSDNQNSSIRHSSFVIRHSIISCFSALSLSLIAFLFVRRGFSPSPNMYLVLWSLLAFWPVLVYVKRLTASDHPWLRTAAVWTVAGVVSSLVLKTFAPLAVLLLFFAVTHILLKLRPQYSKYLPMLVLSSVYAILFITIILPRLLNPRLIPIN